MSFNAEDLKVGDVVQFVWVKNYQHSATMRNTKINNKTFKAEEVAGSYGGPIEPGTHWLFKNGRLATKWSVNKKANYVALPNYDNDSMDYSDAGRNKKVYPDHYDWNR